MSFLLKPTVGLRTGLDIKDLPDDINKPLERKMNEKLQAEVDRIATELADKIPARKDTIKKAASEVSALGFRGLADKSLGETILFALKEDDRKSFTTEEMKELREIIGTENRPVREVLNLDLPLVENPLLSRELIQAKALEFATLAGLDGGKELALAEKGLDMEKITSAELDELVDAKLITAPQKNQLLLLSQVSLVTGENFDLMKSVKAGNIKSAGDMIRMDTADWLKLIKDNKVPAPAGETPESYAANIRETVESSFPTDYFLSRVTGDKAVAGFSNLPQRLEPVLKNNIRIFGDNNEPLALTKEDLGGVDAATQKQVLDDLVKIQPVLNTYRHLGLAEVLTKQEPAPKKQAEITGRINALNTFYANNTGLIDFETTDFTTAAGKQDGLVWKGIDAVTQPYVRRQMAAFQRSFILGDTEETSSQLLKTGFDSASRVVSLSEQDFIKTSGLDVEQGRKVYRKAADMAIGAAHYMEAIRGGIKGAFNNTNASNQHPLVNDLKEIDGFDKLFGTQDYCDCTHCRSVLSPAAYFTDLMYFVQENVSKKAFTGSLATHPLYLKRRRPDLWTLKLSCENTSTEIPYLQVVNEVLEKYLRSELSLTDVYTHLKTADWSVSQPFNLSLEELRLYIAHFNIALHDIYRGMNATRISQHRERLRLSPEELNIVITPNTAGAKKRFRNTATAKFNVQDFIGYAGITRDQLDELTETSFLPEIGKVKVKTVKDPTDIQKYSEELQDLTDTRLDLIHRYLRLWKKTPWSIPEFDLLLNSLKAKGWLSNLEESTSGYAKVLQLAQLLEVQSRLGLTVEELATVVYQLPEKALVENENSFAERVFLLDKIADNTITDKTPFLLAGLGITE
ncbi:MAG TPA: Tc toxin subunit A, partial [Flavisolibacter sp.]